MSSPFKNVLLVGASGSIGSVVLKALLESSSLEVTVLQRESAKSSPPASVKVIRISDSYPQADLEKAMKGQDVIVNCITTTNVSEQYRFIDAAIAVGVKRYVPSEYGLDNLKPEAQALNSVFRNKGEVQSYLRSKQSDIEWMSISCGMWLKWSMSNDFLGMHVREKKFVFWDDGEGYFSCSTEDNTALALVNALTIFPEETKNRNVFLSDFAVTQRQLLAEIERQLGYKLTTESVDSHALIREKQEADKNGDPYAIYALVETGFVTGRYGGHIEATSNEIMSEKLGLPKKTLPEVVTAALKANGLA